MTQRHHYVPLVLLKNFSSNEKIWLFDKHLNKSVRTNIRNAFVEGDFNTIIGDGFTLEAEQIFGRAETVAAPILQSILDKKEIRHLGIDDRAAIATFVTIQHLRSKQSRRTFSILREEMERRFPNIPQSNFDLPGFTPTEADKYASLDFIVQNLGPLTQHIIQKDFLLVELDCAGALLISDHPVVLHNDNPKGHESNLGLAVHGIQIYLPISPSYALAFFCPTIKEELKNGADKVGKVKKSLFAQYFKSGNLGEAETLTLAQLSQAKKTIDLHFRQHEDQKILFNKQNLIFLNSLQVQTAYRFLAGPQNDFALAIDKLRETPALRQPNHIQFG
jgi:hypothetical protein